MNDGFELAEFAELKEIDVVTQQVIINGVPQNVMSKGFVIACPHCGRVIYQFPVGVSEIDALKAKQEGKDELLKIATYCPSCGTKLYYGNEEFVVEQEENQ